jgi:hypothetical protein
MWARVASFEGTDVERMRAEVGRRGPDELIPAGLRGVLSLADAEGKRQLSSHSSAGERKSRPPSRPSNACATRCRRRYGGGACPFDYYEVPAGIVGSRGRAQVT